jgi:hypothetical protein
MRRPMAFQPTGERRLGMPVKFQDMMRGLFTPKERAANVDKMRTKAKSRIA